MNYSALSYSITKNITKQEKKSNGIYFTPPSTVKLNIDLLKNYMPSIHTILEPSCGSGEYVNYLYENYNSKDITAIEFNETIYNSIKETVPESVNLIHGDYIKYNTNDKYDLIIGNPPFYVMKKKHVDSSYYKYFDGRPNIFILFIIKSLTMLNNKGILSFILPKNFLNSLYYDKTRRYINKHCKILHLIECNDKYIETQQQTVMLIIQKIKGVNKKFILSKQDYTVFGEPSIISKLNKLYINSTSLYELGFKVTVGNVVWNQHKTILTNDTTKTRLIYSSDIIDNNLSIVTYKNEKKKNYINKKGIDKPMLLINRGYGVGNYNFNYCLIKGGFEYLIENHLICITNNNVISDVELISLYEKIIKSFENEKTKEFIKLYFGNNAINTTEINYMLPIFI
jgi:tRNA1(Val) A37 N6-methylase TrmN6